MDKHIDILKGILPGKIILRTLKKRNMSQRDLADSISYPYQAINAIIKGKRKLNTELSLNGNSDKKGPLIPVQSGPLWLKLKVAC